ncbi:TetR/AcrR family transcriptional regulator [Metabacillus halosaccharovorans]|uniref:TetR/AcrR family transcriptional regulator n=1 Tax=Metabacillus halosaccharovorans TaxID=930124 RepID=UPI001C1FA4F2|nr:TetR/AcrR family transcriptional regulator [Metabacillus halosaccharovorans]MBU7592246.1 TetR/AcrR family transcriptional regulator [Metabacillus halosaccharovorans]
MGQRGRKQGSIGVESKAKLLSIATEEFATNGFHETKISTIVKKAGVTQPTFYLYFHSKEAIFQELVCHFRTKLTDLTKESRLESGLDVNTLPGRIAVGLSAIFNFLDEDHQLTKIGFFISTEADDIKSQIADLIASNLVSEQKDGYFRKDIDMRIVADGLVGVIERLTVTSLFKGHKKPVELAREIVDLFLYGLQNQ